MSIFGKFTNVFRKVTSSFALTGKSFSSTWGRVKKLPWKTHPVKAYRAYKESLIFSRTKPIFSQAPKNFRFDRSLITPTTNMITNKYQYMFDVSMATEGIPGIQTQVFSFLGDYEWTKATLETQMEALIRERESVEKYGKIQFVTARLTGVRQNRWLH